MYLSNRLLVSSPSTSAKSAISYTASGANALPNPWGLKKAQCLIVPTVRRSSRAVDANSKSFESAALMTGCSVSLRGGVHNPLHPFQVMISTHRRTCVLL